MSKALGASVGIPPRNRKVELNAKKIGSYYSDNPYLTTFWNCLSLLFPQGEKFFVDSVKSYRSDVKDHYLLAQIAGFIGQESFHSREHVEINKLIEQSGIDVNQFEKELRVILGIASKMPRSMRLAATCALEHYTGIMGHQLLDDFRHSDNIMYGYMDLWIWHAIEECEHKCVSMDVYNQTCNSYLLRVVIMLAATIVFFAVVANFYVRMLKQQGLRNPVMFLDAMLYLTKLFSNLVPEYLSYFKPSFHPSESDSGELIEYWLNKLNIK